MTIVIQGRENSMLKLNSVRDNEGLPQRVPAAAARQPTRPGDLALVQSARPGHPTLQNSQCYLPQTLLTGHSMLFMKITFTASHSQAFTVKKYILDITRILIISKILAYSQRQEIFER